MNFRPCNECNKCCTGKLLANIHGFEMGNGKPCVFLIKGQCSIYDNRPKVCQSYQCAWSQGLFDEDMRPDKTGLMVSVEKDLEGQYLKVIPVNHQINIDDIEKLEKNMKELNARYVFVDGGK